MKHEKDMKGQEDVESYDRLCPEKKRHIKKEEREDNGKPDDYRSQGVMAIYR